MRYIKHVDGNQVFHDYHNDEVLFLMHRIGIEKGLYDYNSRQYQMKKIRNEIIKTAQRLFPGWEYSGRQLRRLVRPQGGIVSKYAPIYIAAIYILLDTQDFQTIHCRVCNMLNNHIIEPADATYTVYLMSKYIHYVMHVVNQRGEDNDIEFFLETLGILENNLQHLPVKKLFNSVNHLAIHF